MLDLEQIFRETLRRCDPEVLVRAAVHPGLPRHVAAIGKCAGKMLDGFGSFERALVVVPHGYPHPRERRAEVLEGGHPHIDDGSFRAGNALLQFAARHEEITFLISGGGSACVEAPREPFTRDDLRQVNRRLLAAGLPIASINAVRRSLSAIKGGRLAAAVRGRTHSFILSDVTPGDPETVASGPTLPERNFSADVPALLERLQCHQAAAMLRRHPAQPVTDLPRSSVMVLADNSTLVASAADVAAASGWQPVILPDGVEDEVGRAADGLLRRALTLAPGQLLVAGGEPVVEVRGDGRGGRCTEMALRFALGYQRHSPAPPLRILFAGSDGVDGSSGAAGVTLDLPAPLEGEDLSAALAASDSGPAAFRLGRPIIMPPTGNNLRDLYLVARG